MSSYPCFTDWPLILAGPLLRRTESDAVSVWLALQTACEVQLTVLATHANGAALGEPLLLGTSRTVALGERLHLVVVTARPLGAATLHSDRLYAYDLSFSPSQGPRQSLAQAIRAAATLPPSLSYFAHEKPTFALPPAQVEQLRLLHASCRKPHGAGLDALPIVDSLIAQSADQPLQRPHQLFLTGDQIYGDDVAEPLLWATTRLGEGLLGWQETLPVKSDQRRAPHGVSPDKLKPGKRVGIATAKGGFTAGAGNKPEKVSSHLLGLGEFFAAYLLAWSPVCWPQQFPAAVEVVQAAKQQRAWPRQLQSLRQFSHTLDKVRRALANVAVYTLFDDHDVSDDWNLNQQWCLRVLGQPLGQRTVQNALMACAMFQAWGNTPAEFEGDRPGAKLLQSLAAWSRSRGQDPGAYAAIGRYLALPETDPGTGLPRFVQDGALMRLQRSPEALDWHYVVQGPCHEVVALDTRTWRGFPVDEDTLAPPVILPPVALAAQVQALLEPTAPGQGRRDRITLVISPTNLFSLEAIDWAQSYALKRGNVFSSDVGDAWNMPSNGLAAFLLALFEQRQQLVVLSGDIHYSFAVRLTWQQSLPAHPHLPQTAVMVQLTSSPLKNEEPITRLIHTRLKHWLLPERSRCWQGWIQPARMQEQPRRSRHQPEPDWRCRLEWLPRQPSQLPTFGTDLSWLGPAGRPRRRWLAALRFWQGRWFQDGREVVGLNSLARVRFEAGSEAYTAVQESFWYTPGTPTQIRVSRFAGSLTPPRAPTPCSES